MAVSSVRCTECSEVFRIEGPGAEEGKANIDCWDPVLCRKCYQDYDFSKRNARFFRETKKKRRRRRAK